MGRGRKNRLIQERIHDPYYEEKKYPEGGILPWLPGNLQRRALGMAC